MSKKIRIVDSVSRTVLKTFIFRILIVTADGIIVLLLTHKFDLALEIVVIRNIAAALIYYIHERSWNYITWGRIEKKM